MDVGSSESPYGFYGLLVRSYVKLYCEGVSDTAAIERMRELSATDGYAQYYLKEFEAKSKYILSKG